MKLHEIYVHTSLYKTKSRQCIIPVTHCTPGWYQWARQVKLRVVHAPGMPGTFSPPPWASDPDMHHGTYLTHVPWCMPGSLTGGSPWNPGGGENAPGIPGACATRNFTYLVRSPLCAKFKGLRTPIFLSLTYCLTHWGLAMQIYVNGQVAHLMIFFRN